MSGCFERLRPLFIDPVTFRSSGGLTHTLSGNILSKGGCRPSSGALAQPAVSYPLLALPWDFMICRPLRERLTLEILRVKE